MIRLLLLILVQIGVAQSETQSPLGLPTQITDLYLPGSEVEVIPRKNNDSSLVIRIIEIKSASEGHRYDLEIYGLDPGTHQITDFLRYADSKKPLPTLPATFEVTTQYPLDTLPNPIDLEPTPPKKLGGYKTLIIVLGILWFVILLALIFYRKKQKSHATPPPLPTLHEKLHHLVTAAAKDELSDQERARLERLLIGHWKKELPELETLPPAIALTKLRTHPNASPLILKLEHWLHAPDSSLSHEEIIPLLEPYRVRENPKSENQKP